MSPADVETRCPADCSGRGVCDSEGACRCRGGWAGEDQSQRGIWSRDPVLTSDWLGRRGVPGVPRQRGHPRHRRHVRHVSAGRGHAGQEVLQVKFSTYFRLEVNIFNTDINKHGVTTSLDRSRIVSADTAIVELQEADSWSWR